MQLKIKENSLLPIIISFFIFFYLYLLLRIDLRIVYQGAGYVPFPCFFKGIDFFKEYLNSPGRIIEYFTAFLSQLYYFYYLGPLIVTLILLLIYLLTEKLITVMGGIRNNTSVFIPLILILVMYNKYTNYLLLILSVIVSLLFFWIFTLFNKYKIIFRIIIFMTFFTVLFYISINSLLLFVLLSSLYEVFIKRKWLIGGLYIIFSAVILYFAGVYILDVTTTDTFKQIIPYYAKYVSEPSTVSWSFYFFFPLFALLFGLWQLLKDFGKLQKYDKIFIKYSRNTIQYIVVFSLLCITTVAAVFLSFNQADNINLKMNYFSRNGMWDNVLEEYDRMPLGEYNILINHQINKALYYKGRLLYDMFSYPQSIKSLLALGFYDPDIEMTALSEFISISDTGFRLGLLNIAEQAAQEALETLDERPVILKQLVMINIVRKDFKVAEVYLNKLSRDLIYGKKAEKYRKLLTGDNPALLDEIIPCKPANILEEDHEKSTDVELLFKGLVDNKLNRMGFEYLMVYYLLSFRIDKIAENLHMLDNYKYQDIPRNIEEALIIYNHLTGSKVDLHGRTLSNESIQKHKGFSSAVYFYRNNQREGLKYLMKNYGTTYYFRHFFYSLEQAKR